MLFNGQSGSGIVYIGQASSTDAGATWTPYGSNPIISPGAATTWNDEQVHAPCVVWDGSQSVMFADGYDGSNYRIGRWTNPYHDFAVHPGSWTAYGSNPIIGLGSGYNVNGVIAPQVVYDATLSPPWKMWMVGVNGSNVTTIGFYDSTDGISWTDHGKVVDVGAGGSWNDEGVGLGCPVRNGSTWYIYLAGQSSTWASHYRAGYATVAVGSETSAGAYTDHGVLSAFSGNITTLDDAKTYQSNTLTTVMARGVSWVGYGTCFSPTVPATQYEASFRSTSTDLVTWTAPTGALITLGTGWDAISAENPTVVAVP